MPSLFAIQLKLQNPSFTAESAYLHFKASFSTDNSKYNGLPDWISEAMPLPSPLLIPFDLSPIRPRTVKSILQHCSPSSPGEDRISYLHLRNMPACHHFLATLYSKILLTSYQAPEQWCKGLLKLISKGGDPSQPANFRPIALTSVVGKLFHKILTTRLQRYLLENKIIDTSLQKGFSTGINGTFEHIFTITAILKNAKQYNLPLSLI